jgi:hypothetical protein
MTTSRKTYAPNFKTPYLRNLSQNLAPEPLTAYLVFTFNVLERRWLISPKQKREAERRKGGGNFVASRLCSTRQPSLTASLKLTSGSSA